MAAIGAAIGGAAIGPVTEGMVSAAQYQASKHERNISWKRMGQWELIAPSLRMAGLRAAGLNPILAAGGGLGGGGGGGRVQGASTGSKPNMNFDMDRVMSTALQIKNFANAVREGKARADQAESEAAAARYLPERAYHAAGAEAERWSTLRETVGLLREQQEATAAQRARTEADTRLLETEIPAAKALEDLYTDYPWLRKAGAVLKEIKR